MVLQTAQCVQWDRSPVDEWTGGCRLLTSSVPPKAGDQISPTRTQGKDRRRSHNNYELAWTKIGWELGDDAEYPTKGQVEGAPGTDTEASDEDVPQQAKTGPEYLEVVETDDAHDAVANWPIK